MTPELKTKIDEIVKSNRVVIFMKGTALMPQCGFSATAIQALRLSGATEMTTVDVLKDPEIREGIKTYSNWPTIPQVYIDGQFVGGADILRDLYERGELSKMVQGG